MIQSALGATPVSASQPSAQVEKLRAALPDMGHLGARSGLRETLEKLVTAKPMHGLHGLRGAEPPEPVLPEGARFDRATFNCAQGSREYRVFVPKLATQRPAGMIMMLHGCTQSPVDFANGTDMNRVADENGLIVVYPAQSRGANMQSCWNWFDAADQHTGAGEPAILAALARQMQREHDVPEGRVFVAGLSAGAAMAVILGRTYPEVFAGVGAHSGLAYKAATDMPSAFAAMGGKLAPFDAARKHPVATIVFHGTADSTVHAANGQRIADEARPNGVEVVQDGHSNGRSFTRSIIADGDMPSEHWRIAGLGHAWSGGKSTGSYADPAGPDASGEMARFFLDLAPQGRE